MGSEYGAICNSCGTKFLVRSGPSKVSQVLHCDRCGKEHWISLIDHGLSCDNEEELKQLAGACKCGGKFNVNAFVCVLTVNQQTGEEILRGERSVMINWPSHGERTMFYQHFDDKRMLNMLR